MFQCGNSHNSRQVLEQLPEGPGAGRCLGSPSAAPKSITSPVMGYSSLSRLIGGPLSSLSMPATVHFDDTYSVGGYTWIEFHNTTRSAKNSYLSIDLIYLWQEKRKPGSQTVLDLFFPHKHHIEQHSQVIFQTF